MSLCALAYAGCFDDDMSGTNRHEASRVPRCIMSQPLRGAGNIAVDDRGDIIVATGPRHRLEGPASVIRKFDVNGKEKWTYHVPDGDELIPFGIATDPFGAVIVVGRGFRTELHPNGVEDIEDWLFLLKLAPDGHLDFRRDFQGSGHFVEVKTGPSGDIVVRGSFSSSLDLGGGPLPESVGSSTLFVAKFDSSGNLVWTKDFGNPDEQAPSGVAIDKTGAILLAGLLMSTFDFGGGPLTPTPNLEPDGDEVAHDAFLVKYDASGQHVWSKLYGGEGYQKFSSIAVDAADNAIVLIRNAGILNLGSHHFTGQSDIVASFDSRGDHLFSAALPTTWGNAKRIAVSESGEVFVAGTFRDTIGLEGKSLMSAGGYDMFVVRIDADHTVRTGERFGGAGDDDLWGLAASRNGDVALAGDFQGIVDVGCRRLFVTPTVDAFVTVFSL